MRSNRLTGRWTILPVLTLALAACVPAVADIEDRKKKVEVPDFWLTDLDEAFTKARGEGKPLFVVFRCDP